MFRAAACIRAKTRHSPRACPQVNKNCGPSTHGRHSATAGGDRGGVRDRGRSRSQPAVCMKSDMTGRAHSEPALWGGMRAPSTPAGRGGAPGHHGTGGRGRTDHPGIPVDVHTHSCSLSKLFPNLTVTQSNTAMVHN